MNAIAANELGVNETTDSAPPRWSPADALLVWTVSRIDGGRRHGVEPDCHVVYALTPTHFVEQTRRYRASAQQCIDLLLSGKRVGRTQRKIELNTVMALHSDPRSGRLSIRTLNGTHYLEPVNGEEADILREIAGEIDVRIPPGGARFSGTIVFGDDPRSYSAEEDRRAAVAAEHAREEDESDTVEAPRYELPVTPVALPPQVQAYVQQTQVAEVVESPYVESPYPEESPYAQSSPAPDPAAPVVESPQMRPTQLSAAAAQPVPDQVVPDQVVPDHLASNPAASPVPSDITVAGGVAITFQPVAGSTPAASPRYTPDAATIARIQESPYVAPQAPTTEWQASLDASRAPASFAAPVQPTESSRLPVEPPIAAEPDFIAPTPAPQDVHQAEMLHPDVSQGAAPSAEAQVAIAAERRQHLDPAFPAAFDRREERLFRPQMEEMASDPTPDTHVAAPPSAPAPNAGAAFPTHSGSVDQAITASEMYTEQPNMRAAAPPATEVPAGPELHPATERRLEDSPLPSVFDRRSLRTASEEVPRWIAPDSDNPAVDAPDPESADGEAAATELPAGPPVIGPPVIGSSGPSPVSGGGAIGFNADFDVNPFR